MALLEGVANISEGRRSDVIMALASAIRSVEGVKLFHVDAGAAANRTVMTFAGGPDAVMEAAFRLYKSALLHIDMAQHRGTHPRQGAVDVCPFVPLSGISIQETDNLVKALARRLADDLGIGGYFYELSAVEGNPTDLATLRKGQYEALPSKLKDMPLDFGTEASWKKFGVTVMGCRRLLVAYNVNLNTKDVDKAHIIAQRVRESGYLHRNAENVLERITGHLEAVKGLGWYISDFDITQASYNLTDLSRNGILEVFNTTKEIARGYDVEVLGSELVGMAPRNEFLRVAKYLFPGQDLDDSTIFEAADQYLGLSSVKSFDPEKQVLDLLIGECVDPTY